MNPCKTEKTKSQGKHCPCTCLCVCLSALLRSHWSMQTFCPLAWQTRRKQQRLLFLSVDKTNHISVKKGHKPWWQQPHRPRSKCYIMTSQGRVTANHTWHLRHPADNLMLSKMQESISHFHPRAGSEPDINPLLNGLRKSPKCWHPPTWSIVSLPGKFKKWLMRGNHEVKIGSLMCYLSVDENHFQLW